MENGAVEDGAAQRGERTRWSRTGVARSLGISLIAFGDLLERSGGLGFQQEPIADNYYQ